MRILSFLPVSVVLLAGSGCLHEHERSVAYSRAQSDLGCADVRVTETAGNGYNAYGCGRSERLTCLSSTNQGVFGKETETSCISSDVESDSPPPLYTPTANTKATDKKAKDDDAERIATLKLVLKSIPYRDCGVGGPGKIEITFAPKGVVTKVEVIEGDFDDPTRACIVDRFKGAHVEPFAGDERTFEWGIHLAT